MANMDTMTQLMLLKSMTQRTGSLHEAQLLQIKLWPRMILGTTSGTTVHVDQENHLIKAFLEVDETYDENLTTLALMKEIVGWVRKITWDDAHVVFLAKHRTVYDSRTERRDAGTTSPAGASGNP